MVGDIAFDPTVLGISTDHPNEWLGAHDVMNRHPAVYKVRNACRMAFGDLFGLLYSAGLRGELDDE